jgi:hypothetical protein
LKEKTHGSKRDMEIYLSSFSKILKTLEMDTLQQPLPFWVKEGFIPKNVIK